MGRPDPTAERARLAASLEADGRCPLCPPHRGGDNSAGRKKRTDRYKDRRVPRGGGGAGE